MSRDKNLLHPKLRAIAGEFERQCRAAGLPVLITQTMRTKAEQDALYAKGRTAAGKIVTNCRYPDSPHCWGVAFDFCRNVRGHEYDDSDGFFAKCGAIGKKLGLTWGGDWKNFKDKPHLELTEFMPGSSCRQLKADYGTPEKFIKTWRENMTNNVKKEQNMTAAAAEKILMQKAGLSAATVTFLKCYKYGEQLIIKLAEAIEK